MEPEILLFGALAVVVIAGMAVMRRGGSSTPPVAGTSTAAPAAQARAPRPQTSKPWTISTVDAALQLVLSQKVTLTLRGEIGRAQEVEQYLRESTDLYFPDRALRLAILMSRHNIECPEVEAWRVKTVAAARKAARKAVAAEHDVAALEKSDADLLEDLLAEAADDALYELPEHASHFRSLDELSVDRPADLSSDDAFLAHVDHDPKLLELYALAAGRAGKPVQIRQGQGLSDWVSLETRGLALRGTDIPPEALAQAYRLVDINAAANPPKPVRRKADAAALITPEVAARLPDIQRVFLVKPMPPEIEAGMADFAWSLAHANLLLETVRTAECVHERIASSRPDKDSQWYIEGDCCRASRTAAERESMRRPSSLPPYHVACCARLSIY